MPSSSAAAEQSGFVAFLRCSLCFVSALRIFSLCVERKVKSDSTEDAENNCEVRARFCSACGEKSADLKLCNGCKCVWYCDKKCQNRHCQEHKKECKVIKKELERRRGKLDLGTEMDVGPLEKLPPQEECPICMRVLPIHTMLHMYAPCCGKTVCCGCEYQYQLKSRNETCAFCREPISKSVEEALARAHKRIELKDPHALCNMALSYGYGQDGLSVDQTKCIDLLRKSAGLNGPIALYQIGNYYHFGEMGLEQNEKEAIKHWEKAAECGHLGARHNLGCMAEGNSDFVAAMRHWRFSASGGFKASMESLVACFEEGWLQHADLAETMLVFYCSRTEMKSEVRDQYIKYLKVKGEYKEEFDN